MDALKAAVWVSKLEDRRDALRLRLHTMGIKKLLDKDESSPVNPKRLNRETLPAYVKEKSLSGLLFLISIPMGLVGLLRPKSLMGGLLLAALVLIGIGLLLVALISGSMYYYLSQPVDEQQRQYYLAQHQQRIALTVHDERNELIGALPPPANNENDLRGALSVKSVPPIFWDLIKAPVDQALTFAPQQPSFWTLYKNIIQFKDASYKGINLAATYQATSSQSLLQHIAYSLQGHSTHQGNQQRLLERWTSNKEALHIARHLFPYLAQNDGKEFKRWSAMHAPSLSAKDDVYGLVSIAATLFGKTVTRLTAGQQAILATAYHQQTSMAELLTAKAKTRQTIWKRLIKQTQLAATQHYKKTQPQTLRRIMSDLERMKAAPSVAMSSQWLTFLNNHPEQEQHYRQLLQRSTLTLGKLKPNLYQTVQQIATKQDKNTVLTHIKISLPILQNQQLDMTLNEVFGTIQRFYPKNFSKRLGKNIDKKGALISLRIANEQGNIIRSYQRGIVTQRPIANLSDFAMASVLLANKDTPKTRYCNKAYAKVKNATEPKRQGISNCERLNQKGNAFSLQQSIQQGKRLPLFHAITQKHAISAKKLVMLYQAFGLLNDISAENKPSAKTLAYELTTGMVQSTPEHMHQLIHSLTRQLYGLPYNTKPSIIDEVYLSRLSAQGERHFVEKITKNTTKMATLQPYFSSNVQRKQMQSLFAIPSDKKNNPVKFLRAVEKKYGVEFLLVKSATSKTPNGHIRDKWLVGSLRLKQQIYSFTLMMGSDDMSTGLGKNISHQQLMLPILNALIESLE